MKYSAEVENGVAKETLVFNGKEYTRTTETTDFGCRSSDKDFCEQLENEGIDDEELLDLVNDQLDGFFIGYLLEMAGMEF